MHQKMKVVVIYVGVKIEGYTSDSFGAISLISSQRRRSTRTIPLMPENLGLALQMRGKNLSKGGSIDDGTLINID